MKRVIIFIGVILSCCILQGCKKNSGQTDLILSEADVAHQWADMALYITKNTPANSPTYASRCLGYIGLTMYESIVNGYPEYHSLAGQLNGLHDLAIPDKSEIYSWPIALNAAQAQIIRLIYQQTADTNQLKIDSLEHTIYYSIKNRLDHSTLERSVQYGRSVADQVFLWSSTDGGHRGYLNNFDKKLVFTAKPGGWKPPLYAQSVSHYPLHPHWGDNRTFVTANALVSNPAFIAFDTTRSSAYYQQYHRVYEKEKTLTQDEKEVAIWWADDPDATFTPPGHSYYLTKVILKTRRASLIESAMTYAQVSISVADAFRNCWKWKYIFFSERPNTFIPEHMDQNWESFWPEPPFPAFPSGHAIQGSACATILAHDFGDAFNFVDSAHYGRKKDMIRNTEFKPRTFHSFSQMAKEIADSRFYGGIHTQQDNQAGLDKGKEIAENVLKLKWKN